MHSCVCAYIKLYKYIHTSLTTLKPQNIKQTKIFYSVYTLIKQIKFKIVNFKKRIGKEVPKVDQILVNSKI